MAFSLPFSTITMTIRNAITISGNTIQSVLTIKLTSSISQHIRSQTPPPPKDPLRIPTYPWVPLLRVNPHVSPQILNPKSYAFDVRV